MIRTLVRTGIVFTALLLSNNLAGGTTVRFDGGGPPPTCVPSPDGTCPKSVVVSGLQR